MTPADRDQRALRIHADSHRRPADLDAWRRQLHADRRRANEGLTSWWLWAIVLLSFAAALGAAAALAR